MEYIYSALVLHAAGKKITDQGIKKILEAAGIEVDEARVKALTSSLEGVNIEEAMASAVTAAPVATAAPAAAGGEDKKPEEKEEEEEEEEEEEVTEEEAAAGLGALFG